MEQGFCKNFRQKGPELLQSVVAGREMLNIALAALLVAVGNGDDGWSSPCQADVAVPLEINEGLARCVDGNIKLVTDFFNGRQ